MPKKHKNWPEICKVGKSDGLLMLVLATTDPKSKEWQRLAAAFPECFCDEPVHGPYPLSLIRAEAHKVGKSEDSDHGAEYPVSYSTVPGWIPMQGFDKFGNNQAGIDGPILPKEINPDAKQGEEVTWGGREFVVIENNESCEELWIAPAECIQVDL